MFILVLFNPNALAHLRHIIDIRIIFDHTTHTKLGSAGADRLLHIADPSVWNAIAILLKEGGDNLSFKDMVERIAIVLGLSFLIVIITLLANGPAIFTIIALGPPAIQDTTVGLSLRAAFCPLVPLAS
ncbi:hypothetical protein [Dictyobacter kobayashii]|uniref:hypothetical protein n=1 Tax=Dictyobacter kobayashii TaxID=2014872 RepID=UPI001C3F8564|nr:hypothetical protein [Dictyobacter kobayashii]